jgi:hypothetical protein
MSPMPKGRGEQMNGSRATELRSRRKRRLPTRVAHEGPFVRAFADALRDILRAELRLTG